MNRDKVQGVIVRVVGEIVVAFMAPWWAIVGFVRGFLAGWFGE